ncbi:MAG: copper oxidase [Desulfobulbus propionicus]|nr:MAG: copper oxidase [Desulfobulbus propionicus]
MIYSTRGLHYLRSSLLPVPHGMFARTGGHSTGAHASLNFSLHVHDNQQKVLLNRQLAREELGLTHLASAHQVHGNAIQVVTENTNQEYTGYDALITNRKGVGLLIQQADCQAVLLYDPIKQVIGAVHCGWRGSVCQVLAHTIERMQVEYRVHPRNLRAVISPSLGPCCAQFIHYQKELPRWMHAYQVRRGFFDFWAISRVQLVHTGVPRNQIETAGLCTKCSQEFFSYRQDLALGRPYGGRGGSIIGLPERASGEELK